MWKRSIVSTVALTTAGTGLAIVLAATAAADPNSTLPSCTTVDAGGETTECTTPGNVQIDTSAPVEDPVYGYPDEGDFFPYGGPVFVVGGGFDHGGHR